MAEKLRPEEVLAEIWSESGLIGRTFLVLIIVAIMAAIGFAIVVAMVIATTIFLIWVVYKLTESAQTTPEALPPPLAELPPQLEELSPVKAVEPDPLKACARCYDKNPPRCSRGHCCSGLHEKCYDCRCKWCNDCAIGYGQHVGLCESCYSDDAYSD